MVPPEQSFSVVLWWWWWGATRCFQGMASTRGMWQAGLRGRARGHQLGGIQSSVLMWNASVIASAGDEMPSIKSRVCWAAVSPGNLYRCWICVQGGDISHSCSQMTGWLLITFAMSLRDELTSLVSSVHIGLTASTDWLSVHSSCYFQRLMQAASFFPWSVVSAQTVQSKCSPRTPLPSNWPLYRLLSLWRSVLCKVFWRAG